MMLLPAIDMHIARKRDEGAVYQSQALELRCFGKYLGNVDLQEIKTEQVLAFLNSFKISTYTWRRRYLQLKRFFRHLYLTGEMAAIRMPPPRGYVPQTFTPYVYSQY